MFYSGCFKKDVDLPNYYLRKDVNHFTHLVSLLNEVKSSKFNRTKELITCGMGLLVFCASIGEAEKIFETIFIIILSKYDGEIFESDKEHTESNEHIKTPCAEKNDFSHINIMRQNHLEIIEQSNTEL